MFADRFSSAAPKRQSWEQRTMGNRRAPLGARSNSLSTQPNDGKLDPKDKSKLSLQTAFGAFTESDTENEIRQVEHSRATDVGTAKPATSLLQSLRKTLKATVSPKVASASHASPSMDNFSPSETTVATVIGNKTIMASTPGPLPVSTHSSRRSTPTSLLKSELMALDSRKSVDHCLRVDVLNELADEDTDENLLCSPTLATQPQRRPMMRVSLLHGPVGPNKLGPPQRIMPAQPQVWPDSATTNAASVASSTSSSAVAMPRSGVTNKAGDRTLSSILINKPVKRVVQPTPRVHFENVASGVLVASAVKPRRPPDTTTSHRRCGKEWAQALMEQQRLTSPINTPRGVVMDLSSIFHDAQTVQRQRPPLSMPRRRQQLPPSTTRSTSSTPVKNVKGTRVLSADKLQSRSLPMPRPETPQVQTQPEHWADQQCFAVTAWLNHILRPHNDDDMKDGTMQSHHGLRTLLQHQALARDRRMALQLFGSDTQLTIRQKVHDEIAAGRIQMRQDRDLVHDLPLRRDVLGLLFSYSLPWLRLGLETMFGAAIAPELTSHPQSPGLDQTISAATARESIQALKIAIKTFIVDRVLADEPTLHKYTKGLCRMPSGKFERWYRAEMRSLVVYRLLTLFLFIDHAKQAQVLNSTHQKTLFSKQAQHKSTKAILLAFCRNFLSAEGDFAKHLSRLGVQVHYVQDPIDEMDWSVINLATELRDGVVLGRLVEILSGQAFKSVLRKLRLPAVSRLQKLHNVKTALAQLCTLGVKIPPQVAAHHIVDGHRGMVMALLWSVVTVFALERLLDTDFLRQEVLRLADRDHDDIFLSTAKKTTDLKDLVEMWCAVICRRCDFELSDMTHDFATGKLGCYLVHFYHPHILRRQDILQCAADLPMARSHNPESMQRALGQERRNLQRLRQAMAALGGIPLLVPDCDSSTLPNEESVYLCIVFLCSRLLESKGEVRACVLIQQAFRRRDRLRDLDRKIAAAKVIERYWYQHRDNFFCARAAMYGAAVRVIETFAWYRKSRITCLRAVRLAREREFAAACKVQRLFTMIVRPRIQSELSLLNTCATTMQSWWRMIKNRKWVASLLLYCRAASLIQRQWRQLLQHRRINHESAERIQCVWRSFQCQINLQMTLQDVVFIQCHVRRFLAQRDFQEKLSALFVLQHSARSFLLRRRLKNGRLAAAGALIANLCQRNVRRHRASRKVQEMRRRKKAAVCLQAWARKVRVKCRYQRLQDALIRLQRLRRNAMTKLRQKQARRECKAAIALQSFCRVVRARRERQRLQLVRYALTLRRRLEIYSAVTIQSIVRRFLSFRLLTRQRAKASILQACFRRHMRLQKLKASAASRVASMYRMKMARSKLELAIRSAAIIQACFRHHVEIQLYQTAAASLVQTHVRRVFAVQRFQAVKVIVLAIQKQYRMRSAQLFVRLLRRHCMHANAATIIQAGTRCYLANVAAAREMRNLVRLQAIMRSYAARLRVAVVRQTVNECAAATTLQCWARSHAAKSRTRRLRRAMDEYAAARMIQKTWRCFTVHVDFMLVLLAAVKIQSHVRCRLGKAESVRRLQAREVLHRLLHRSAQQNRNTRLVFSVCKIQSCVRMYQALYIFRVHHRATRAIQRLARGWLCRIEIGIWHFAACEIQRSWRAYVGWAISIWRLISIVRIQAACRMMLCRHDVHALRVKVGLWKLKYTLNARRIQLWYRFRYRRRRNDQAACRIQSCWIRRLQRRRLMRASIGITVFQARARGRLARRRRSTSLVGVARRLKVATHDARAHPELLLGNRALYALEILAGSTRLADILVALKTLELATRLSRNCCLAFVHTEAHEILFAMIKSCNRSLPHVELLHYTLQTMANIMRHDDLVRDFANADAVEIFLDLLQLFRDKDKLFALTTELLERALVDEPRLHGTCGSKENLKRLHGVRALCQRKLSVSDASYRRQSIDHPQQNSNRRLSLGVGRDTNSLRSHQSLRRGIRALKRIIELVET